MRVAAFAVAAVGFLRIDAAGQQVRRDFIPAGDANVGRLLFAGVGINEYARPDLWDPLKNAEADLKAVWQVFSETFRFESLPGFVMFGPDATKRRIDDLLDRLRNELTKNDTLVFYFAGHGKQIPGLRETSPSKFYLVPYEVQDRVENTPRQYVDVEDLLEALGGTLALHVLVIIDACRSDGGTSAPVNLSAGWAQAGAPAGQDMHRESHRLLVSVKSGQSAADRGAARPGHSRFTGWLLTAIENAVEGRDPRPVLDADHRLTFRALFDFLEVQVSEESGGQQVPFEQPFHPFGEGALTFSMPVSPFSAAYTRAVELSEEDGREADVRAAVEDALARADVHGLRVAYLRYLQADIAEGGDTKTRAEALCELRAALDNADYSAESIAPMNRPSLRRLVKNVTCPNDSAGG